MTANVEIFEINIWLCDYPCKRRKSGTLSESLQKQKSYMEKIRYREDGQLMAQMQAADFFRLRPLRNKTGVHIQIIQRRGMPFFFLRNKKRKAFFTGMILGGILIFFFDRENLEYPY